MQQTNCHPFRYDRWLWVHNGAIKDFHVLKRDLVMAVDPELYPSIEGSTDSEVHVLPGPHGSVCATTRSRRWSGWWASSRRPGHERHGVDQPMQMTVATTDGERIFAFRYLSSIGKSRTLLPQHRGQRPPGDLPRRTRSSRRCSDETRIVVSEPLGDLLGAWNAVPELGCGIVQKGEDVLGRFAPQLP